MGVGIIKKLWQIRKQFFEIVKDFELNYSTETFCQNKKKRKRNTNNYLVYQMKQNSHLNENKTNNLQGEIILA